MSAKILITDDEKDIVEMLRMVLESHYEVLTAYDGVQAMEIARKDKPDLIILDVTMPRKNGYQVCREIKNDEDMKSIPVILLTAKDQESDKFWGQECGANHYITKPYETKDLLDSIKNLLKK